VDPHALTVANVTKSLKDNQSFDFLANLDNLKVVITGGKIAISFKPSAVFDEADTFKKESGTTLVAAKAIWGWYPAATEIVVDEHGDFTDTVGNTTDEVAASTDYSAATGATLNMGGLVTRAETEPWIMYYDADGYYVHPAIWKNVSNSDRRQLLDYCSNEAPYC